MRYGDNRTIHHTQFLDVEITPEGEVVSVWFRCMRLPFKATVVDSDRADEMRNSYQRDPAPNLIAVDVFDEADSIVEPDFEISDKDVFSALIKGLSSKLEQDQPKLMEEIGKHFNLPPKTEE